MKNTQTAGQNEGISQTWAEDGLQAAIEWYGEDAVYAYALSQGYIESYEEFKEYYGL